MGRNLFLNLGVAFGLVLSRGVAIASRFLGKKGDQRSLPLAVLKYVADLLELDWSQACQVLREDTMLIIRKSEYLPNNLDGSIADLLVRVPGITSHRLEDGAQVGFISKQACAEGLSDHFEGETCDLDVLVPEALEELRIDGLGLVSLEHGHDDLESDVAEVGLAVLNLVEQYAVHHENHGFDLRRVAHIGVQAA